MATHIRFVCTYACVGARLCVLPQIPFVGSVLDVVTDVVVHSVSCCAVSSIKHLKQERKSVSTVCKKTRLDTQDIIRAPCNQVKGVLHL